MSLPRNERQEAEVLLKQIRDGMERLAETTPSPPQIILDEFNQHFKDEDKSIARPTETNGLAKITILRQTSIPTKLDDIAFEIKNPLTIDKDGSTRSPIQEKHST
jgi:hypothetical protein